MRPRAFVGRTWASPGSASGPAEHWVGKNPLAEERLHKRAQSFQGWTANVSHCGSVSSVFREALAPSLPGGALVTAAG